ncbi:hypothetical protein GO281_03750 [Ralstonia solanacearum]|nr:hypothetical protein [Ralstonia solanacearum]NKF73003.1 hypothetical protein [Ralstonia solanacearum]BEU51380.1 hypothetical protein MAFF211520_16720 [Ralstonia pseudosolanacearum]BEU56620.1 hypothetical protein MAFF211521_16730 [Ralstonia pseudosolanacearum]BEU62693.1 hypothetical protein MAFF301524_24930 [Ralstonia pseudosolanacearum]
MDRDRQRWKSGRHADGDHGQRRLKDLTSALLRLIERNSRLPRAELEYLYGLGLSGPYDRETGQEWRRYACPRYDAGDDRHNKQALRIERLRQVAADAIVMGHVTQEELRALGLLQLLDEGDPCGRFQRERRALKDFAAGLRRYSTGRAPLAPAGRSGGCPPKLNKATDAEKLEWDRSWRSHLASLGGEVFEDRDSVTEQDLLLQEFIYQEEERVVTDEDYRLLEDGDQPFDPRRPNGAALNRLRIRFQGGNVDAPWYPQYRHQDTGWRQTYPEPWAGISVEAMTDDEIDLLFDQLEKSLAASACRGEGTWA